MVTASFLLASAMVAGVLTTPLSVRHSNLIAAAPSTDSDVFGLNAPPGVTVNVANDKEKDAHLADSVAYSQASSPKPDEKKVHSTDKGQTAKLPKEHNKTQGHGNNGSHENNVGSKGSKDSHEQKQPTESKEERKSENNYGQNSYGADSEQESKFDRFKELNDSFQDKYGQDSHDNSPKEDQHDTTDKTNYGQNSYGSTSEGPSTNQWEESVEYKENNYGQNSYGVESKGTEEQHGSMTSHGQNSHGAQSKDSKDSSESKGTEEQHNPKTNYGQNSYGAETTDVAESSESKGHQGQYGPGSNYGQDSYGAGAKEVQQHDKHDHQSEHEDVNNLGEKMAVRKQ
jgi:hypothetical protein